MAAGKYDWRAKMKEVLETEKAAAKAEKNETAAKAEKNETVETEQPATKAEKYDWRSKIKEAKGIVEPPETTQEPDWRSKIDDVAGAAHPLGHDEKTGDWRFKRTIANAIRVVRAEQEAQREKDAAEKARLTRARSKAGMLHEKIIMPLLNRLRDDFAAHKNVVLREWHVQSSGDVDRFSGEAATSSVAASDATRFAITAEASVTELGEFVNLSVECSAVDPKSTSTSQFTSLFEKKARFPAVQIFDELGSRTWFHTQLAECVKLCTLTSLRQSTGRP
jgi:hypothetical protein